MKRIRPAAVAGSFYTGQAEPLAEEIASLLAGVAQRLEKPGILPKAVIVPHAGYIYSGPVAAGAYALLRQGRDVYRRVVLLGPVHRVPVRGLALPDAEGFATPLGVVPLDLEAMAGLAELPQVVRFDQAHAWEHSLEVQLPFLQTVLNDFKLVPLAVGDATPQEVAEVLERLWGGRETLIVISSDLSHFLPYREAQRTDGATAQAILALRGPLDHQQACGGTPVNGLLVAARNHRLQPLLLDLRNSGDTAGDKSRVVGYAAFAFTEEPTYDH
ncbi:MAG: AmmeMemoRadiSam system protein B [Sulfuricella sp.]|nr:AmmeMemoRadiSam system protein B [Sulfuricella sp.]